MIFGLYHSRGETVGLIGEVLKSLKLPFTEVHLYDGDGLPRDVSDLEGLIVMGGPMNVDEVHKYPYLLPEVQLIEKVLSEKKPVLGVCLGAQLMAKALGSRVFPNPTKEVGWHPIKMTAQAKQDRHFKKFPETIDVLHWHGDTFDLPKDAVHLAETKACANQAFRYNDNSYALQFHFEVTPSMAGEWCAAPSEQSFIKAAGETPGAIVNATAGAYKKLEPHSKAFFTDYLKLAYHHLMVPA